jgi:hypothetical protein
MSQDDGEKALGKKLLEEQQGKTVRALLFVSFHPLHFADVKQRDQQHHFKRDSQRNKS